MTPKYFDAHTHLNIQFDDDWREAGKRAIDGGTWFVNIGAGLVSSQKAIDQAEYFGDEGFATVGLHPTESQHEDFVEIAKLAKNKKVVAIGECGLDYFKLPDSARGSVGAKQKELFIKHIELALALNKPLMIHCRPASTKSFGETKDAYEDLYEILKSYKDKVGDKLQFNIHFFSSDWATAKKFLDLGGYLSFPGVITFSNQYDQVIKNAPLDRLMAETDAPFAAPVSHRGKRNEPIYVQFVAEHIADLRLEPREEVLIALVKNARRFYNLN